MSDIRTKNQRRSTSPSSPDRREVVKGASVVYPLEPEAPGNEPAARLAFAEAQIERTADLLKRIEAKADRLLTPEQLRRLRAMHADVMTRRKVRLRDQRERLGL